MVLTGLAGLVVLLGLCQSAGAKKPPRPPDPDARYHMVLMPDGGGQVTNSGVVLSGRKLLDPVRDAAGNPVWDTDGDDVADGYTITILDPGVYSNAHTTSINDSLDVVGYGTAGDGSQVALLWRNTAAGHTLVELGRTFTDAEVETFTDVEIYALGINNLGQVLVYEHGGLPWTDPPVVSDTFALAVVNPKDSDGDGTPDTWFEDIDEDGTNDLMVELEYGSRLGAKLWGEGSINNLGQTAAMSNLSERGLVVAAKDTDGDGAADVWFEDLDGDGRNDLAADLGPSIEWLALSDSGVVVGTEIVWGRDDHFLRWQIDEAGNVELVAEESGAYFMTGVNNSGQAVGYTSTSTRRGGLRCTAILWEPDLSIIKLVDLLDNPSRDARSLRAFDINNAGYIMGDVTDDYPVTVAFIAVPLAQ
jgi:hypothetical protein